MQRTRRDVLLGSAVVLLGLSLLLAVVLRRRDAGRGTPVPESRPLRQCEQVDAHHWRIPFSSKEEYFRVPARLNEDLHLKPVVAVDQSSITELKIAKLSPGSPMALAGFQVGDRIVRMNGKPVETLSRAMNLANEVRSSAQLTVQVEREGRIIDYQFDFE